MGEGRCGVAVLLLLAVEAAGTVGGFEFESSSLDVVESLEDAIEWLLFSLLDSWVDIAIGI